MIAPPPIIYLAALIFSLLFSWLVPVPFMLGWLGILIGLALMALGLIIAQAAFRELSRHKTPPDPTKPTMKVVQEGVFRFSRNPIYLAFTLIYLGFAFAFNSPWALVFLVPVLVVIDRGQIPREEKCLARKFGEEYFRYKVKVRRWI